MWQSFLIGYFILGTTAYIVRRALILHNNSSSKFFNLVFWLVFFMPSGWIIGLLLPHSLTPGWSNIFWLFIGALFWPIVGLVGFRVNKEVDAGFYAIIGNLSPIITFVLAVLWLQEIITGQKLLGIFLLILSGFIVAIPLLFKGSHASRYGLFLALIVILSGGIGAAYERWIMGKVGLGTYIFYAWTFQTIWVAIIARKELKQIPLFFKHTDQKAKQLIIIFGIANVLRTVCYQSALFISGSAAIISASSNFLAVTVLIAAFLFLKEKQFMVYKIIAVLVGLTGLLLVS